MPKLHNKGILWFNSLMLSMLPLYEVLKDNLTALQPYLNDGTYKYVGLAVVIFNIVLHFTQKEVGNESTGTEIDSNTNT